MSSFVKQEPQDEAEIQAMAARMIESNRAKLQLQRLQAPANTNSTMSILSFIARHRVKNGPSPGAEVYKNLGDEDSARGRFGWTTLGKNHIPFILRKGERYCAVRIIEMKVLNKYLTFLHQDIYSCTCIRSYYVTENEYRLLNDINFKHCDFQFGREPFSPTDLIVRLSDAVEFYNFLDACYNKLINGRSSFQDRCGFIRINKESVVPYTVYKNSQYVPLFYFEGEIDNLKLKAEKLEGWDLSYLKFCCKVQGIRNELFAHDSCAVISLEDITNYFPPGTTFEEYWPNKVVDTHLLINGKTQTQIGQWTREPLGTPVPSPYVKPSSQQKTVNNNHPQNEPPTYANYGINTTQSTQPSYIQSRSAPSAVRSLYPPAAVASRQARPYYTNMPQLPPLIRGSQRPPYANPLSPSNYMIFNEAAAVYDQQSAQIHKYPPPLISSRSMNGEIPYDTSQNHYRSPEMVDLITGNSTPLPLDPISPELVRQLTGHTSVSQQPVHQQPVHQQPVHQQPAHQQPAHQQPAHQQPPHQQPAHQQPAHQQPTHQQSTHQQPTHQQPTHQQPAHQQPAHQQPAHQQQSTHPQIREDHQNMTNGHINSFQRKLIPIAETPTSGNHIPYKIQKALIDNRMVPCINMKPYVYTDLLVTIPDLVKHLFDNVEIEPFHRVMQLLGVELYKGNNSQMRVLFENGKCQSINDYLPLVPVRLILEFMPQIKYMLAGLINSELSAKRRRIS